MNSRGLTYEVVSLLQHIELSRAGFRDRTIRTLILGTLWLENKAMDQDDLAATLKKELGDIDTESVKRSIDSLVSSRDVLRMPNGTYKITEEAFRKIDQQVKKAEELEIKVKNEFIAILNDLKITIDTENIWQSFKEQALIPAVRDMGVRIYNLITRSSDGLTQHSVENFFKSFEEENRFLIQKAVNQFLRSGDSNVRSYVLGLLNAFLAAEATAMDRITVERLTRLATPEFILFLDTNCVFSILNLHENPSNEAVNSLMHLLSKLSGKVKIKLYVLPITIEEAKDVLIAHKAHWGELVLPQNLQFAATRVYQGGFLSKYIEAAKRDPSLTPAEYFKPYISDLSNIIKDKGITVYNQKLDSYRSNQQVIDDIVGQQQLQDQTQKRKKTYKQLEHDMILWHFVNDQRVKPIESPLDAKYWVLTIDYQLLSFDSLRTRNQCPVCIHPSTLLQLLQFWVPRTPEFENALFSTIRLPFFLMDFDVETERIIIDILKSLSRFENVGDMSPETVTKILVSKGLREKLMTAQEEDKKLQLVREELIELHRQKEEEIKKKEAKLVEISAEKDKAEHYARKLEAELEQERQQREALRKELEELRKEWKQERETHERDRKMRNFVIRWGIMLLLFLLLATAISWIAQKFWELNWGSLALLTYSAAFIAWIWIVDKRGGQDEVIKQWSAFRWLHRFGKWLFSIILISILANILANALWDWLKNIMHR
jgi:hypothetical protein